MARIELRHTTIRIIDGYENEAQVNDSPVNGDTVLGIDTLDVAEVIDPGVRFTIAGDSLTHYVTAQNADDVQLATVDASSGTYTLDFAGTTANPITPETTAAIAFDAAASAVQAALEGVASIVPGDVIVTGSAGGPYTIRFSGQYAGLAMEPLVFTDIDLMGGGSEVVITQVNTGGSTREITFTPPIATATGVPADDAVITFSGHTVEAKLGDGNLTYTENWEYEYELDRGELDTVREGDDQPMEVNMDAVWEFLTASAGDDTPTLEDAIKKRGKAADWVSVATTDPCAPYAVDIEIEHDPPCGGEQREIITLPEFRPDSLEHNADEATISMTGRCNAKEAIVTRVA